MSYLKSFMASQKEEQYGRLMHDDEESESSDKIPLPRPRGRGRISSLSCLIVSNIVLVLVVLGLLARNYHQTSESTISIPYTGVSPAQLLQNQIGVASHVVQTYRFYEENIDDMDFLKGDPYWSALFPKGDGQVLLEDEIVESYKLPPSIRIPAKQNLTAYFMAGYHSLHCIAGIRQVLGQFMAAHITGGDYNITEHKWQHTVHCLADLRQVLFCNFDETLLAFEEHIHPGYHQQKVCKNMAPIDEWLEYNYIGKF
ncbi:hypothetical protein PFICI_14231 [Pestalotiopsis fici W106-1]|uniref:Uncharacterized protein n=1 Tax=Pestalotiopsis fici (strain W106-1 / CGMCC3.15140) TaxID=1229662 RepID=W3WKB4_PESFW|nr:uncharacterized protein PFICI_14231 [Pestalotiopsis fici W106-1]ETS74365.1 hypothetical protein PFICI_14231 [Pestalotiopsis fici W106-1]